MFERLEPRQLLAFALNVNFQPGSAATPAGYVADAGKTYGDRGNGQTFGWNADAATFTRDRNNSASPDQRYDTLVHTQLYGSRTWELAVPNGSYSVRIVAGDPSYTDSTIRFAAENVIVADGKLSESQHFIDATKTVTVSDGRLTISNASGASNNKLCFVQVSSATSGSASVSIAAADSSASEPGSNTGMFKVTRSGSTASSLLVKYSVSGSASNGVDYEALGGSVTIPAGASSADIVVTPLDDSAVEGGETVKLTLLSGGGFLLGTSSATITIADDDAPAGQWVAGPSYPLARFECNNAVVNGKLYVFGGYDRYINAHVESYSYDPTAKQWSRIADLPEALTHSGVAVDGNDIYLAGGFVGFREDVATNHVWKFDTTNGSWTLVRSLPAIRAAGALVRVGRVLHFFGGTNAGQTVDYASHWQLNLDDVNPQWTDAPAMPDARNHMGFIALDGRIYAIGGQHLANEKNGNDATVNVYFNGQWSSVASLPFARSHNHTSTFIVNGKIVITGGQSNGGTQPITVNNVTAYDPAQDKWFELPPLPATRQACVGQLLGDQIIVTGGATDGTVAQSTTWLMDASVVP